MSQSKSKWIYAAIVIAAVVAALTTCGVLVWHLRRGKKKDGFCCCEFDDESVNMFDEAAEQVQ